MSGKIHHKYLAYYTADYSIEVAGQNTETGRILIMLIYNSNSGWRIGNVIRHIK